MSEPTRLGDWIQIDTQESAAIDAYVAELGRVRDVLYGRFVDLSFADTIQRGAAKDAVRTGGYAVMQHPHWFPDRMADDWAWSLLKSSAVSTAFPELEAVTRPDLKRSPFQQPLGQESTALALGAILASALVNTAYNGYEGNLFTAKMLGEKAAADLLGDRYEDFEVMWMRAAWSPWFSDIAWDDTLVIADHASGEVVVLCSTDED